MRPLSEVVSLVGRVDRVELTQWVELGWVKPAGRERDEPAFSDLDVARICLICDLRHDLAVEEETMPLVLSLLDQVYALRRQMNALTGAIRQQPDEVRRAILDLLDRSRSRSRSANRGRD
jgi:chaperone modulatory protein CbpM